MRRDISLIIILTALVFTTKTLSFATQDDTPVNARVSINPTFGIAVTPSIVDFGSADPGTTTQEKTVTLECVTNNNKSWVVTLNSESPLTAGTYTIPNKNFLWRTTTGGSGTINDGTGHIDTSPFEFYVAGTDEYITTEPVVMYISFKIDVPAMQAAGDYVTQVVFTMNEQ